MSVAGVPAQTTQLIRRRTENPKTVLAFFATVIGLVLAADVTAIGVLAWSDTSTYLIPWLLLFAGLLVLLLIGGVFFVAWRDPSKLMLGRVTGDEYAAIQQVVLGTSTSGERLVVAGSEGVPIGPAPALGLPAVGAEPVVEEEEEE